MEKVSIIIPVYNGEKYITRCIDSVLKQTYKNIEIICLNDGSKDNTLNILKTFNDKRLIIVDKVNSGVSDTRNLGIKKATGDYIAFCDADDFYESTYIEYMLKALKTNNVDAIRCNYKVIDTDGLLRETGNLQELNEKIFDNKKIKEIIIPKILDGSLPCFTYLIMVKKDIIKNIKFPNDIHMMEDVIFYINLMLELKNIYVLDKKLYTIMFNMEGATNSYKNCERNILNIIDVNKYIFDILKKQKLLSIDNQEILCRSHVNSITDFLVKYYVYDSKKTLILCEKLYENKKFINMLNKINIEKISFQRRVIIKNFKEKHFNKLNFWLMIRKIVFQIRRHR